MKTLWHEMNRRLLDNEDFILATIVASHGSSPRSEGAHMLIAPDLSIWGTIGGGKLEAEAIQKSRDVFDAKASCIHAFFLTGEEAASTQMICGGEGEIVLDYYDSQNNEQRQIFSALIQNLENGQKAWLITGIMANGRRQQCLVNASKEVVGTFDCEPAFYQKMVDGPAKLSIHSDVLDEMRIFIEPIIKGSELFIFGAGHVSHKLAPIAESVDFHTTIIDDRIDFANVQRFPNSQIVLVPSLEAPMPSLGIDEDSYIVIVTRGHMHDGIILEQMLSKELAYIGMIGSKRKRDLLYKEILSKGVFTEEDLARVFSPIGIAIKAESPEEIAISIVAELIRVRAERHVSP
ncbi:XdhC family protein [Fusibacter paucivorans]|uniref:XdhC family protein n=1 Tax=Fusibacter paucivorans TaxID=76009 RepID=A0ABS5PTD0_9FIRM|nr:XdhC/CoxI family protein [Fusibacter paucivorans]MBS7528434.1 XdhC family protein [Fusibacter paucivorans]